MGEDVDTAAAAEGAATGESASGAAGGSRASGGSGDPHTPNGLGASHTPDSLGGPHPPGGSGASGAENAAAPSVLTSVVVHAAGAVCTRRARVDVPPGDGDVTVRVGGLPLALVEHSLRGRVAAGPGGWHVVGIRADLTATLRRADRLPAVRLDLEDAEDRCAGLRDRKERLEQEIAEVAELRAEPPQPRRGDPPRWAPVESFLALAGFVDTRLGLLHGRLRAVEDELADAEHAADVLRARLHEASTAVDTGHATPAVTAVLTLARTPGAAPGASAAPADPETSRAPAAPADPDAHGQTRTAPGADGSGAEIDVDVEYHVPGASWVPTYQLRMDGRSGEGTLVLRACVAQRTGEDWDGVRLGLSTADLLRRADLPRLRSLRIGRSQQEPAAPGWREPPAGLDELFAGYDGAAQDLPAGSAALGGAPGAFEGGAAASAPFPASVPPPAPAAPGGGYGAFVAGAAHAEPAGHEELAHGGGPVPPPAPGAAPGAAPGVGGAVHERARRSRSAAPMAAKAMAVRRSAAFGAAQEAPGYAPAQDVAAQPPGPASPGADLLDYAALTLAGPDAPDARGTLRPAPAGLGRAGAQQRRRAADEVGRLPRPAHAVDVRASAGSFDYRFDTAAPADVASDGRWHVVPIGETPVLTESRHVCVPAVDSAVFGTVVLTNTSPHALLAGPVDVMVDGDFALTAALPTLAPGQRQSVGVGVAESVQVARRTRMRESTAGLRGGTTVLDHTVEIEVANRFPYPVSLEVRERVPVSEEKDVRIEEHRAQPAWERAEEPLDGQDGTYVRGARVWRIDLAPGRTATLTGGYEIRVPAGKSVVGGNRRN